MEVWFILFNARTLSFLCFQNFLIAKKKVGKNVSASIAKKKIVENVHQMLPTPETPRLGRIDVPNETTLLAQCSLLRKRRADQERRFPADFIRKGFD